MTFIALPASLTSIGDCTFLGCFSMTSIELPAGFLGFNVSILRYAQVSPSAILQGICDCM